MMMSFYDDDICLYYGYLVMMMISGYNDDICLRW